MKTENIIFIEYNGVDRPFQVFTDLPEGFDFFYKNGYIQCEWSSLNSRPFLDSLTLKGKDKKLKVWFREDFRPTNNVFKNRRVLNDKEITKMGYVIIKEPKYLKEIVSAIEDC